MPRVFIWLLLKKLLKTSKFFCFLMVVVYNQIMDKISFGKVHNSRKKFLKEHAEKDHQIIEGKKSVLLSAPHGVNHVRLGKEKYREVGSLATALLLQKETDCFLIAKTKNSGDDANFDPNCKYRKSVEKLIESGRIKYLIDLHGLGAKRNCDVNLGIHLGKNIESNLSAFENLKRALEEKGFVVCVDSPFMGGSHTIAGGMKNKYPFLWTIQIEVNCAITNKVENFGRFQKLLQVLKSWIENLY